MFVQIIFSTISLLTFYYLLTRILAYSKDRNRAYVMQTLIALMFLITVVLYAMGEGLLGAVVFFLMVGMVLAVRLFFKGMLDEISKMRTPLNIMEYGEEGRIALFAMLIAAGGAALYVILTILGGFSYADISSPCSVVSAEEVGKICGLANVTGSPVATGAGIGGFSFCMYSSPDAGYAKDGKPAVFMTASYIPSADPINEIKRKHSGANSTWRSYVKDEDLGIGDSSFFLVSEDLQTNITHMAMAGVSTGASFMSMDAFDPADKTGRSCQDKEKLEKLASLALTRLKE